MSGERLWAGAPPACRCESPSPRHTGPRVFAIPRATRLHTRPGTTWRGGRSPVPSSGSRGHRAPAARTAPGGARGPGGRFRLAPLREAAPPPAPPRPAPPRPARAPAAPPASRPAPAHLALADAEDAAAAAQAHAGAPGQRGRAAEGEGAARGAQPLHRGAHERGGPAPPARPQVQVAQRDEHGRPPAAGRGPGTLAPPAPGPAPARPPEAGRGRAAWERPPQGGVGGRREAARGESGGDSDGRPRGLGWEGVMEGDERCWGW